jgi:hypothetical protein
MKSLLAGLLLLIPSASPAAEDALLTFIDPRATHLYRGIQKGEDTKDPNPISRSLLIVSWAPAPNGEMLVYQISGIEGYHSKERVESFLKSFYEVPPDKSGDPVNVIVAGNNWAAGQELKNCLKPLSKAHAFDVFFANPSGFKEVRLQPEPEDRLERIRKAFEASAPAVKAPKAAED